MQYSGGGLWGRDYTLDGPTEVRCALLPHAADWQQSGLWTQSKSWNEPLVAAVFQADQVAEPEKSLLNIEGDDWEIPTAHFRDGQVLIRLFNPSASHREKTIHYGGPVSKLELVQLNGQVVRVLAFKQRAAGDAVFKLALPSLGIGTLRITP
jgi:alpha-mannosidase